MSRTIKFNHNWNGKLNCYAFSTIRLDGSFDVGDTVSCQLIDRDTNQVIKKFDGVIAVKTPFYLDTLNDAMSLLDFGCRAERGRKIIQSLYDTPSKGWAQTLIYHYVIAKAEPA